MCTSVCVCVYLLFLSANVNSCFTSKNKNSKTMSFLRGLFKLLLRVFLICSSLCHILNVLIIIIIPNRISHLYFWYKLCDAVHKNHRNINTFKNNFLYGLILKAYTYTHTTTHHRRWNLQTKKNKKTHKRIYVKSCRCIYDDTKTLKSTFLLENRRLSLIAFNFWYRFRTSLCANVQCSLVYGIQFSF